MGKKFPRGRTQGKPPICALPSPIKRVTSSDSSPDASSSSSSSLSSSECSPDVDFKSKNSALIDRDDNEQCAIPKSTPEHIQVSLLERQCPPIIEHPEDGPNLHTYMEIATTKIQLQHPILPLPCQAARDPISSMPSLLSDSEVELETENNQIPPGNNSKPNLLIQGIIETKLMNLRSY